MGGDAASQHGPRIARSGRALLLAVACTIGLIVGLIGWVATRGEISHRASATAATLSGHLWRVTEVCDGYEWRTVPDQYDAWLAFDANGTLTAYDLSVINRVRWTPATDGFTDHGVTQPNVAPKDGWRVRLNFGVTGLINNGGGHVRIISAGDHLRLTRGVVRIGISEEGPARPLPSPLPTVTPVDLTSSPANH